MRTALLFPALALILSSLGCTAARVRAEASPALECPEYRVNVDERTPGQWIASGCGRVAICEAPKVAGAEPRCAGGGPEGPHRL
jgi:hypothetical protein